VELRNAEPVHCDGVQVTPVELNHVVPCFGFLVQSGDSAVALVSDTGPTDEIWRLARECPQLRAVFLESAFPNSADGLAKKSKHLTPAMLLAEYRKLDREVPLVAIHIKPAYYDQIVRELRELRLPGLTIGQPGRVYEF
jgi:ribonuclease BN (tRNA processing enzyme)